MGSRSPRDSLMIIRDILVAASREVSKSEIVFRSNINSLTAERYLSRLLLQGLLETVRMEDGRVRFRTTKLGSQVLAKISEVERALGEPVKVQEGR